MTEQEWLTSTDPQAMLRHLNASHGRLGEAWHPLPCVTDRKLRLFACGCLSQKKIASIGPTLGQLDVYEEHGHVNSDLTDLQWATNWARNETKEQKKIAPLRAAILRDIFGNPFQPVTLTTSVPLEKCSQEEINQQSMTLEITGAADIRVQRHATWLTEIVLRLAQSIYDNRDWSAIPALADALEEAGCREEAVLRHLRGEVRVAGETDCYVKPDNFPHVRGCWVIDLILGKG